MKITLQYFEGCPNWETAVARLKKLVKETAADDVAIDYQLIDSPEMAERVGFHGSPTFLVDGRDPFLTGDEEVGMMCRVYRTNEGFQGAPTEAQLRRLLSKD